MPSCTVALLLVSLFFFNDTATTEIYTLSLHDALPISSSFARVTSSPGCEAPRRNVKLLMQCSSAYIAHQPWGCPSRGRSEEHTSELQSQSNLVCRLLLEKKNTSASQT